MNCFICAHPSPTFEGIPDRSSIAEVDCPRCGIYRITDASIKSLGRIKVEKYLLSAALRYLSDRGRVPVLDINDKGEGTEKEIVESFPIPRDPLDMVDLFLQGISIMQGKTLINRSFVREEQISLIAGHSVTDVNVILKLATDLNYITKPSSSTNNNDTIYIQTEGWKRLREIKSSISTSNRAFVAMHFSAEMKKVFNNVFKPVLESQGYEVANTINPTHNGKIDDFIIAEIRKSSLMIADFSKHRPNVYFEAGFATGLNIEVIKTIKASEKDRHFDTRQYNHIEWKDEEDLRTQLIHRIESLAVRPEKKE